MSDTTYLDYLNNQMHALETEMARARHKMELGAISARAEGLKQLADLHQHQLALAERIKRASEEHAETWSELHKGMQIELDGLRQSFEKWLTSHN